MHKVGLRLFLRHHVVCALILVLAALLLQLYMYSFSRNAAPRLFSIMYPREAFNIGSPSSEFYQLMPLGTKHLILRPWPYTYLIISTPVALWVLLSATVLRPRTSVVGTMLLMGGLALACVLHEIALVAAF